MALHRLLLEIEPCGQTDRPVFVPPFVITDSDADDPSEPEHGDDVVRIVVRDGDYLVNRRGQPGRAAAALGQPCDLGDFVLRVDTIAADRETADTDAAGLEPELWLTTVEGQRVKRFRCRPPREDQAQLVIGRSRIGTDLMVYDDHVSRRHLRLFVRAGELIVEDLGSKWGTRLNGRDVHAPMPLRDGDEVQFGKSSIRYVRYDSPRDTGAEAADGTPPTTTITMLPPDLRNPGAGGAASAAGAPRVVSAPPPERRGRRRRSWLPFVGGTIAIGAVLAFLRLGGLV